MIIGETLKRHEGISIDSIRFYVISRLPDLEVLDDVIISADERDEAKRIYGKRRVASRAGPGELNARR